ncbi:MULTISPECIES: helix-turn-helix transcriptional regulator [Thiomicrorhabdus]|uniref:Helix-turn-helix transcriptional regulator n=1 Tax=Thiomicrorhabdus heinhorstiae TaxID=2748010 RepID=A0ABS0BYD0_9GAMM|nr:MULTISPECIES: helix-turn-helix transcriptional regulator [Thiomicrorhabdus]MBF6058070.1 helix-turn-helix transcriptional regulator [Thiomicrorhabdus heinhorstiae]
MSNDSSFPNGNVIVLQDAVQLGVMVRDKRKQDGLTQQDLAAIANVGVRFVSELENGKKTVQFDSVMLVLQALGLQLSVSTK